MNPLSVIRSDALTDPRMQKAPAVYMTLAAITTFTTRAKDGYCYFKQETVAQMVGKSRQALSRDLNKLADWGYLEIIPQNYRGFKSNNAYRVKYDGELHDATSRCNDATSRCITTQRDVATKCSSINAIKEKKALTREEFLREIDKGYQANAFAEFSHLTETEIFAAAYACLDFYGMKGEWPAGEPIYVFRHWIRGGLKKGSIRKADKPANAFQESKPEIKSDNLPEWKQKLLNNLGQAVYLSWIKQLELQGNELIAPSKFHAQWVTQHYSDAIDAVLTGVKVIHRENSHV